MQITTERLIMRPWQDEDRAPFAAMSTDPEVMRYLRSMPTRVESDAWIDRQIGFGAADGFCFGAVVLKDTGAFIGSIGLMRVPYEAHFTPAVEIGWRLARPYWGLGYAPEAAAAALRYGFTTLDLPEIVADAVVANANSQRVMLKLGMSRDMAGDFDHPTMAADHPMRRHVLYRLTRAAWQRRLDQTSASLN
jgi:RimJ/RimL family protein N-acetyltransferase